MQTATPEAQRNADSDFMAADCDTTAGFLLSLQRVMKEDRDAKLAEEFARTRAQLEEQWKRAITEYLRWDRRVW